MIIVYLVIEYLPLYQEKQWIAERGLCKSLAIYTKFIGMSIFLIIFYWNKK